MNAQINFRAVEKWGNATRNMIRHLPRKRQDRPGPRYLHWARRSNYWAARANLPAPNRVIGKPYNHGCGEL